MTAGVASIKYGYEYEQRLRVGLVGCGGTAFTGIVPTFQYTPFDLVAACDLDGKKAAGLARVHGATGVYTDYKEMLAKEQLDVVFIIISYPDGKPKYPEIAKAAMEAGCHVWMEKPPGHTVAEVEDLIATRDRTGKMCFVAMSKLFLPTVEKMKELADRPDFGPVGTAAATYPINLPPMEQRKTHPELMRNFLDHIWHPGGVLLLIGGPARSITHETSAAKTGGGATIIEFKSGAVGLMYHAWGRPSGAHVEVERYEMVGVNNKVVVRNSNELIWYRGYERERRPYPLVWNYIEGDDSGALVWKPEMSRSAAYNNSMFMNGNGQKVIYFAECLLSGTPPAKSNLEYALELMKWYEAHMEAPGKPVAIG
jgi:predicted dehydrogenase